MASSITGRKHVPLTRRGDEALGTITARRGGWSFYKITRGGWSTVEKDSACAETPNRATVGAPVAPIAIEVDVGRTSAPDGHAHHNERARS